MRQLNKLFFTLSLILGMAFTSMAQEGVSYANTNSINPIPYYEQLYKQRIWTRVDLKQKQNKGFFSKNREITKILLEAVQNDEIQTFYNAEAGLGELDSTMTKEEFNKQLLSSDPDPGTAQPEPLYDDTWPYMEGETVEYNGVNYKCKLDNALDIAPDSDPTAWEVWKGDPPEYFTGAQITTIEIMEDIIFDKRRAREYRDIISVKLIVSPDYTNDGFSLAVVTFAYKDLEKFFKEHPEKAIWYNQYNSSENRNLADAFALRLFHGQLFKVENPDDLSILDIYGVNAETGDVSVKAGLIGAEYLRMKMLEREHNLWSY